MGRVATRLERVELVLQHQSHLAQQTELVGSRDDHPAPGPDEPSQFPHERTRVLQMLDRLDGHHEIAGSVRQRSPARVQVDSVELSFVRETIIVNDIDSDVSIEPGSQVIPQVTGTAPDIDEDSAPSVPASDGIGDRSVDLLTTNSQTLQAGSRQGATKPSSVQTHIRAQKKPGLPAAYLAEGSPSLIGR